MRYKLEPFPHQLKVIEMANHKPDIGLLWEMGTGKTGAIINILRQRYTERGRLRKTLILSPLVTLFNWQNEFKIHSYIDQKDIVVLHKGGSKGKIKQFVKYAGNLVTATLDNPYIFITNYETLQSADFLKLLLEWGPEIVVLDESHLIKTPTAKRAKAAVKVTDQAKHTYIMTGTPILNSIIDVFNQFKALDNGQTFGRNFHVFKHTYLEDENSGFQGKKGYFPKLVARTEKYGELTEKIYTKCDRVLKKDVLKNLPPLTKTVRHVELSPDQRKHYKEMERDFITFVDKEMEGGKSNAVVAQIAAVKALRLQQICCGYLSTEDGDDIFFDKNPRLELVAQLLQEIVIENGHKCILWCSFINNYKQLGDLCTNIQLGHTFLTGKQNLTEKREAMDLFNSDENTKVIIANRRAGGIGINLIAAPYSIVYSRNFSLGEELQSEARNYRSGSERHQQICKIDIAAHNTIDERVLEALTNKEDISKKVIDLVKGGK